MFSKIKERGKGKEGEADEDGKSKGEGKEKIECVVLGTQRPRASDANGPIIMPAFVCVC